MFRGINPSLWLRTAYLLTIVCFVTLPLHFLGLNQSLKQLLVYFSAGVFLFDLLAALLSRPRDVRIAFYGFFACLIHLVQLGD